MSTSLDTEVRDALEQRKGDWQAVADGSGVSYSWISKFMNGHIDNPGFATLTKLHKLLAPRPIAGKSRAPGTERRLPADLPMQATTSGQDVAAPLADAKA